jgi:carbonic anhydrase
LTISALEALRRLREGNRRFASGMRSADGASSLPRRAALVAGQEPFAIILGCSDSRVPAEMVFDQGLGDLFVVRVAGNIVAPSQIGSVEFAAERFGTRLVVVLGHSRCGAVIATLDELRRTTETRSRNLRSIVDRIRPSVARLLATDPGGDPDALVRDAVRANVRAAVDQLRHGSEIIVRLIESDGLLVVGAEYDLESGVVHFLDGAPAVDEGETGLTRRRRASVTRETINPRSVFRSLDHGFSQGVVASGRRTLYVSGQTAWDSHKQLIGGADLEGQARRALLNLQAVVEGAGGTLDDVVSVRIYVVDYQPGKAAAVARAFGDFFSGDVKPACTWVGVAALADPFFLIEVEATALLD